MTLEIDNLEKKIKKNIYGKLQTVIVTFPAGLSDIALKEIETILKNPWFAQPFSGDIYLLKNEIFIKNIRMHAVIELLMRNQCLSDIRLIIFQGKAIGKEAFEKKCRSIHWNFFINKKMSLKIKVDSVASKAFHETALKEIISEIIKHDVIEVMSGENTNETTCLYAYLHKDRLTMSISLAGNPLYKRGYRGVLSASAPLREDAASACIQKSLEFAHKFNINFIPESIIIPFSGTGTFAFEYIQSYLNFSPVLFGREYALQKMPLFKPENFNFLVKKAKEKALFNSPNLNSICFYCIDNSNNANSAFIENTNLFRNALSKHNFEFSDNLVPLSTNFIEMDVSTVISSQNKNIGHVFLPLNPPYGIRLGKNTDSITLYKNIAHKINEISKITREEQKNLLGFILCPNEETWVAFYKNLVGAKTETYHFTQGGIDIRVCQFFI